MNREDIIRMGHKAGLCEANGEDDNSIYIFLHLERFAKLVAEAEREACATIIQRAGLPSIAAAIRARGQQAEPVQPEPLTWLLINKTGARPLIYGDAAAPQQAEPVADATITTATLACKKPVKQAEPVTVCCCGDPTILETWHRKDAPCFAPQMAEPVAMDKIKRTHTAMTLRDFQQNADHEYAGMPHRIYRQTSSDGCYLCACLAEIDRLKQQAEPVQAEPVAESHRRATTGASGQSMTQADSGNPSF